MKGTAEGIAASIGMFFLYFSLLFIANGFDHAITQTIANLPFIIVLILGFGVQVALYVYTRAAVDANGKTEVAASGVMSTGSMAACCAHHLLDFGILMGISGLLALVAKFQTAFFALAIASNIYGITLMLLMVKKHKLYRRGGTLHSIADIIPLNAKNIVLFASIVIVPLFFLLPLLTTSGGTQTNPTIQVIEKTVSVNDVEITALPSMQNENLQIQLILTTHAGSLDMDLEKDAVATDTSGRTYYGQWNGSPTGGHHRSGTLTFSNFNGTLATLKIDNVKRSSAVIRWN